VPNGHRISRNHHYIPVFIIKNFSGSDKLVFWASKKRPSVRPVPPKSIFFEKNANTLYGQNHERSEFAEFFLSKMDRAFSIVCHAILDQQFEAISLEPYAIKILNHFIYQSLKRSPIIRDNLRRTNPLEGLIDELNQHRLAGEISLSEAQMNIVNDKHVQFRALQNALVENLFKEDLATQRKIESRHLYLVSPAHPKKNFILGNQHLVRLSGPKHNGLDDWQSEWWMPVHPQFAILSTGHRLNSKRIFLSNDGVRKLNLATWQLSSEAAANSRELLTSLISNK
jgi:Protein of unknown function (DUF4238)